LLPIAQNDRPEKPVFGQINRPLYNKTPALVCFAHNVILTTAGVKQPNRLCKNFMFAFLAPAWSSQRQLAEQVLQAGLCSSLI
jgi:hypothetical protein